MKARAALTITDISDQPPAEEKQTIDDAPRRAQQTRNDPLQRRAAPTASDSPKPRFEVVPIHSGFAPGVDPIKLNQLDDQLQAEEFIRRVKG